ncbi:MAG: LOG family protein [Geminocystis sp.]|nr:LOG family protein [Geminocystis sp.]MCS7148140.1 LOG family protein [Geminocystis sp.]MCX8078093.1 LOG family protein [Geminocystis sp.]MDW8116491.1 LOG family protein [Geminocystis sp.]HIK36956.1 LOG family protein [Geminocystis sp. M7585_C2015_104]
MSLSVNAPELRESLKKLLKSIPSSRHNKWLKRSLKVIVKIIEKNEIDRLEWKILSGTLRDLEKGFRVFSNYKDVRKVTIFGSARAPEDSPEYQLAREFAQRVTELGFMVLTGAGGGIMEAGNRGATSSYSFGLNVKLPFEQNANPFIADDPKLINFRYFFTRKLFFLKETDAIVLFPGGFGTQDEAFETITLCQTGRQPLVPLILMDKPGGDYWQEWHNYLHKHLLGRGYVDEDDLRMYHITDNVQTACDIIQQFYRVYHSSRYVKDLFVIRLNYELTDEQIELLNEHFSDLLLSGRIERRVPKKLKNDKLNLPQIVLHLQSKKFSRLYQMINMINSFSCENAPYCLPQYR